MTDRMSYDSASGKVILPAGALASFAVPGRGLPFNPAKAVSGSYDVDTVLNYDVELDGLPLRFIGSVTCTERSGSGAVLTLTVCGCRRTDRPEARYTESAKLAVLGYLWCRRAGESSVTLRLLLSAGTKEDVYEYYAGAEYLESAVFALIRRADPFIRHTYIRGRNGFESLRRLPFPYHEMRESQYEFITEAFRTIKNSSRLLVSAPTGTGKTISALYPAVRAIGEGHADKIFCLCSKTTVGKAFTDAAELLSHHAPLLRCAVISSKERCCPVSGDRGMRKSKMCSTGCRFYAYADGKCAKLRLIEGAAECLNFSVISPETIKAAAEKHCVCPHELSLFVSEYCDIVICDYNYIFDFRIRLRRYFSDDTGERFVFLADEVHNLPKRAMDTYSAEIDAGRVTSLISEAEGLPGEEVLASAARNAAAELENLRAAALREGESRDVGGKTVRSGFINTPELPSKLAGALGVLRRALGGTIMKYGDALPSIIFELAEAVGKFCHVCSLYDTNYTCLISAVGDEFYVRLCCLDPAPLLDRSMRSASAVILFSATLTPISYYADILGCGRGEVLELDSPFPHENLCPVAVDSISMKLSERDYEVDSVAECIAAAAESRTGNYLAFFPSFDYMEKVLKAFRAVAPETPAIVQKRSMSSEAREGFLAEFRAERDTPDSLVGFAVLGGIFSEGIDLPGERLVGVIIAGTGMPAITSERNIMREYFDLTRESGMEYAYTYPGFNSVLQAAGRVIRTASDRGVLILIDSRYAEPGYYRLFPKYWRHIKYTGDPFSLEEILRRFWEKQAR